jgi:UDP-N-acetylmuramoylalanine-D-glutamate ligase
MRPSVLVCGGRDWRDGGSVLRVLQLLNPIVIISGGCPTGADRFARDAAEVIGCNTVTQYADWRKYGRAAGPIRNQEMLDLNKPDVVVAFPGGRGTADMVRRARAKGVRVIEPIATTAP